VIEIKEERKEGREVEKVLLFLRTRRQEEKKIC